MGGFENSPASEGYDSVHIETGTVVNVNVRNYTVDFITQYSSKHIPDVRIMAPYLHFNNGEGFTVIPEVGATAAICIPSDGDPAFVLGFIAAAEMDHAKVDEDLESKLSEPGVETEDDIDSQNTTDSGGSTAPADGSPTGAGFRSGRPILNPGDMLWQGRDENFVAMRRGGVLQLGSTNICQRAYIPLLNIIRDFSENYELNTAAGTFSWRTGRVEDDPGGQAPTEYQILAHEYAQDEFASIKIEFGSLDNEETPPEGDKTFIQVTIAPQAIDRKDGTVEGDPMYVLRLDKAGNTYMMQAGTRTVEIKVDDNLTVDGNRTELIKGNDEEKVDGDKKTEIGGTHEQKGGATSKETWGGNKSITAPKVLLGAESASEPGMLGLKLVSWLAAHTHKYIIPTTCAGAPTDSDPPTQKGALNPTLATKVFHV